MAALIAFAFGGELGLDIPTNIYAFYLGGFLSVGSVLAQAIINTIILVKVKK